VFNLSYFSRLCYRSCIGVLGPLRRMVANPCRQHTLVDCYIVLTYTMHKLRTCVCLCSQHCSLHVMPRDPVTMMTGSLGILFWTKTLTRDTKMSSIFWLAGHTSCIVLPSSHHWSPRISGDVPTQVLCYHARLRKAMRKTCATNG
jgi:hypothetical protein